MKERILSASRIKTLETCSWSYWCSYHLKIPQRGNDGSKRGTLCHLIFELLMKKRHKKHFTQMMKRGGVEANEAVKRLVKKHLDREKIHTEENYTMVCNMIWVGINNDFFCEGAKLGEPEKEFLLESENPKYKIKGFMDKIALYKKSGFLKIVDYKSSKGKFKGDELVSNIQALTYTLAAKKEWPNLKKIIVDFVFLRFPKEPVQSVPENTEEQLKGFETYLAYIYKIINNFTEKLARSNFAADEQKNKWLCKAGKTWECPYYRAIDFFALVDENNEILESSLENKFKPTEKQRVEKKRYDGCPAHNNITKDFFLD